MPCPPQRHSQSYDCHLPRHTPRSVCQPGGAVGEKKEATAPHDETEMRSAAWVGTDVKADLVGIWWGALEHSCRSSRTLVRT
jgi:hypothetical protein